MKQILPTLYTSITIANDSTTIVQLDSVRDIETAKKIPLGIENVVSKYLHHNPPTFSELEAAITEVEDELMIYMRTMMPDTELFTYDKQIKEIAGYVFSEPREETVLTATDIEMIFGRLGAIISGRPASSDNLPTDNKFLVCVLIVREVLAHLKFKRITILSK